MKKILLAFLLLPVFTKAQQIDSSALNRLLDNQNTLQRRLDESGKELIKFRVLSSVGNGLEALGAAGIIVSTVSIADLANQSYTIPYDDNKSKISTYKSIIGISAGVFIVGFVIHAIGLDHLNRAGLKLQGTSIVMPFGK